MRYLPTLEVRGKMIQVALPDIHGVALAEAALLSGERQRDQLQAILLDSPMLLFWVFETCKAVLMQPPAQTGQLGNAVVDTRKEIDASDLCSKLVEIVGSHSRELIRDHGKNLTSIERFEFDHFLDFYAYFRIKQEPVQAFSDRIFTRVALLQRLFDAGANLVLKRSLSAHSSDDEAVYREFQQSDFSRFHERESILAAWNMELPFFRGGLAELDQRLERIEKLENEFEEEVEKAKMAAMRQLAYGASHEVNNPLANISTRAQALLRDETDPKRRQRLQTIDAQAFRAHDMISNLMTFARPPRPVFSRFQLLPVVQKVIDSLQSTAQSQQTAIELEVESALYFVADQNQVREMIFALVQNSLEAIRQNGKVRIKAAASSDDQPIAIEVIDDGPGISPEVRQHIFDPFFSGREAGRGLGFGLSKVWRFMELHQGKVEIADLNGLTCVRLQFPPHHAESPAMEISKTA